jgi:hypothetical protein
MFDDDPCRDAWMIARRLPDRVVRRLFSDLVHDRDVSAAERLRRALGPLAADLDLADALFRECLLDCLEYRISPPDEEDPGPAAVEERRHAALASTAVLGLGPVWSCP